MERYVRNTTAHKPVTEVSLDDVIAAMFEADDLRNVLENQWEDIFHEMDMEELDIPPITNSYTELAENHRSFVRKYYEDGYRISHDILIDQASSVIAVSRALSRLSDLTKPLGVHWSRGHHEGNSEYGSHFVWGEVTYENVDWITTVARHMFWGNMEDEITIVAGASVRLVSLKFGEDAIGRA